jgi:hypothetical protein
MSPLERILLADEDRMAYGTGSAAETANQPAGLAQLIIGLYNSLEDVSKRAFGASETMRQGGPYNPAPMVEAAMLPMGTGAIAGVPMKAGEAALGAGVIRPTGIRGYHASPHDFDRFDMSKIGTGEGAQAYGHGLYFAENPAISGRGGQYDQAFTRDIRAPVERALAKHGDADAALAAARAEIERLQGLPNMGNDPQRWASLMETQQRIVSGIDTLKKTGELPKAKIYEVNINADPAHFLDWDKPLSGQTPEVAQKLKDAWLAHPEGHSHQRGQEIYSAAMRGESYDPSAASTIFREAGIPGIKYLDQGSRAAGEGSRNYVVFDDKLIDILRKYGIVVAPPVLHPLLSGSEEKT